VPAILETINQRVNQLAHIGTKGYPLRYSGGGPERSGRPSVGSNPTETTIQGRKWGTGLSMQVRAAKDGRARTRINWLLRQLRDAPDDLRITVKFARTRATASALLDAARADLSTLLLPEDAKREPTMFEVADTDDMGIKRGTSSGSFVAETQTQMLAFYGDVVQQVQKWAPKTPKLSKSLDFEAAPSPAKEIEVSSDNLLPEFPHSAYLDDNDESLRRRDSSPSYRDANPLE